MVRPSPREGAPTAKRAQVQADVLRATEALLSAGSSYADLNVEKIATAAGISRTAFYFYFSDKRDLLMRLAGDVVEELYGAADKWFFSATGDAGEDIRAALDGIALLYDEHGTLLRAVTEVSTYDEEIAQFWRGLIGRFVDATARRIEAEQAAGNADPMPVGPTAFALTWGTERTLYQLLVQDPMPREDIIDGLVNVYRRTLYGRLER